MEPVLPEEEREQVAAVDSASTDPLQRQSFATICNRGPSPVGLYVLWALVRVRDVAWVAGGDDVLHGRTDLLEKQPSYSERGD